MLSREQLLAVANEVQAVATQDKVTKQYTVIYGNTRHIYFVDYEVAYKTDFTNHVNKWAENKRISTLGNFTVSVYECYYKKDFEFLCDVFSLVGKHYATVVNDEWELM